MSVLARISTTKSILAPPHPEIPLPQSDSRVLEIISTSRKGREEIRYVERRISVTETIKGSEKEWSGERRKISKEREVADGGIKDTGRRKSSSVGIVKVIVVGGMTTGNLSGQ